MLIRTMLFLALRRILLNDRSSLLSCLLYLAFFALVCHSGVRQSSHKTTKTKHTILKTMRPGLVPPDIQKTKKTQAVDKGSPRVSFRGANISFKGYRDTYITPLRVKGTKQSYIPRAFGFLSGSIHPVHLLLLRIYKIICIIVQSLAHDKRSLPWG